MSTLEALHKKYPWNSINRFMPIATKHGFSKDDVKNYFKQFAHDKLNINVNTVSNMTINVRCWFNWHVNT